MGQKAHISNYKYGNIRLFGEIPVDVMRDIDGHSVVVSPVFEGGHEPDYWEATIDNRLVGRKFSSPKTALQFAQDYLSLEDDELSPSLGSGRPHIEV